MWREVTPETWIEARRMACGLSYKVRVDFYACFVLFILPSVYTGNILAWVIGFKATEKNCYTWRVFRKFWLVVKLPAKVKTAFSYLFTHGDGKIRAFIFTKDWIFNLKSFLVYFNRYFIHSGRCKEKKRWCILKLETSSFNFAKR